MKFIGETSPGILLKKYDLCYTRLVTSFEKKWLDYLRDYVSRDAITAILLIK